MALQEKLQVHHLLNRHQQRNVALFNDLKDCAGGRYRREPNHKTLATLALLTVCKSERSIGLFQRKLQPSLCRGLTERSYRRSGAHRTRTT